MVDVSRKPVVQRTAVAEGQIYLEAGTVELIEKAGLAKGNVLAAARLAGIMAAKKTSELIPLCHPLPLTHCEIKFTFARDSLRIRAAARTTAQTGVEMEALTAVAVAALTIYDMCKAADKNMRITDIRLVKKTKTPLVSH